VLLQRESDSGFFQPIRGTPLPAPLQEKGVSLSSHLWAIALRWILFIYLSEITISPPLQQKAKIEFWGRNKERILKEVSEAAGFASFIYSK